ncbi:coatomer subunit alpha [Fragilaria crotonensis]|nr:coatomer subunit alpha [Fragilaria crotonensis]
MAKSSTAADGEQNGGAMGMSAMLKEVQDLADKFKVEEDEQYISPYAHLEKAAVLQEARIFHDPTSVRENPRKCCTVIAQLLHLQNTGQKLSGPEATEVFFGVTKLFMSDDASLRRMVYLFIKEVAETCDPDDVIIVTSCLTKDMTCDVDLYRANALRVLARIVDAAMLGAIERYVKQAVVDSSGQVASSALVSAAHLFRKSPECAAVVKRWISETTEATQSPNEMLVQQYSERNTLKSPLALVLLIRYATKLLHDEAAEGRGSFKMVPMSRAGFQLLESSLRHKSEMVVYEAARAICNLPQIEPQDLSPAVSVLQLFLSSPKPAVRFASMRTLATVASIHPRVVAKCNEDFEALIGDGNRSIATLAITTLLKTGSENSVDRLLKQISAFLTDIADEYKITVVRSLQQLCLTYPSKHRVLVGFLSNFLREEGGFDFKRSIVASIVSLIRLVPETTESSLHLYSSTIELSSKTLLFVLRLYLLCLNLQLSARPETFHHDSLKRSLNDEDDETRDRSALAVTVIEEAMISFPYVPPPEGEEAEEVPADNPAEDDTAAFILLEPLPMSFDKLERSLKAYAAIPNAMTSPDPVSVDALPVVEDTAEEILASSGASDGMDGDVPSIGAPVEEKKKEIVDPAAAVYAIPELAALGRTFRSSQPVQLTESETEYVVQCIKHIFPNHVVLQFTVQNTIEEQRLDNVTVVLDDSDAEAFNVSGEIAADGIAYGETKSCFAVLERDANLALSPCTMACELRFTVVQVDPTTGDAEGDTFEEEYPLEDLEISTADFMAKVSVPDFRKAWDAVGNDNEVLEKFALQFKKLEDAVSAVIDLLGMQPCDGTAAIKPNLGGKPHMLHLSGIFVSGEKVLGRAQIAMQGDSGVVLKIAVRSDNADVSRMVADCIR